ncbi:unnamed protein product [Heterobilharzia americana]|nr:unnamed protein product [Heterobilharzia americana]
MLSTPQPRLQQGFFTISPASGLIPPGNAQIITVDCVAKTQELCEEKLTIEITDRDMILYPYGIPYQLIAEGHLPSIETNNYSIIFEEHHVCKNLSILELPDLSNKISSGGIYGIEENRFVYRNVLVGSRVSSRFRIANQSNVPADVSFEITSTNTSTNINQPSGRSSSQNSQTTSCDSFEVVPEKIQIEPHSSIYANVTFAPMAMQIYSASFHVYLDNKPSVNTILSSGRGSATSSTKRSTNTPVLTFELYGEGNLPRIDIIQPKLRNRTGQTMCVFKRIQVGRTSSQTLTLYNNGILNSRVNIDLTDPDGVFSLKPQLNNDALLFYNPVNTSTESNEAYEVSDSAGNDELSVAKQSHIIGLLLKPGNQFNLTIYYIPNQRNVKNLGQIQLSLVNNEYEDTLVELIGETLNDEVCLEDVPQLDYERYMCIQNALRRAVSAPKPTSSQSTSDDMESDLMQDETQTATALQHNYLDFGDCSPNDTITRTITITHCGKIKDAESTSFRFTWPTNHPVLQFRPSEGHLHVNQSKRIEITFKPSGSSITLKSQSIKCNLHRILVPIPEGCTKPVDWDDTKQIIRWVDAPGEKVNGPESTNRSMATTVTTTTTTTTTTTSPDNSQEQKCQLNADYGPASDVVRRKQKLIEIESEPNYEEISDRPDPKPLELFISGVADFVQYKCEVTRIDFKETHIFEKRIYRFEIINSGLITLHFNWSIQMMSPLPETLGDNNTLNNRIDESYHEQWERSLIPFTIDPVEGSILPGKSYFIEVTFNPLLLGEFVAQLTGSIDNLPYQSSTNSNRNRQVLLPPIITITGKSENSILHFDLYDSDYLSSGRRNPELPGPIGTPLGASLDPFTRVIEFNTVGLGLRKTRYFSIINTTKENFEFMIKNEDSFSIQEPKSVKCLVDKGIILAGKKINIGFEFISYQLGLIESFWRFHVKNFNYNIPLLIVGETREPNIIFDQSYINFHAVLIGHTISKTVLLINEEVVQLSSSLSSSITNTMMNEEEEQSENEVEFEFLKSSLYDAGKQDSIIVKPMSGHLLPGEKLPIEITFQANGEREVNINLQCNIKHKNLPLTLNIKAQGYAIHSSVWLDYTLTPTTLPINKSNNQTKSTTEVIEQIEIKPLWSPCIGIDITELMNNSINRIKTDKNLMNKLIELNIGQLNPGEYTTRKLIIYNNGKFKIDFLCQFMLISNGLNKKNEMIIDQLINGFNFDKTYHPSSLYITPNSGSLLPNEKFICTIKFHPLKQLNILGINHIKLNNLLGICLIIRDGPIYGIKLFGSIKQQPVQFSTTCINFGYQLIMQPGLKPSLYYLYISNLDRNKELSIECISQPSKIFTYTLISTILAKKQHDNDDDVIRQQSNSLLCIPIEFFPQDNILYKEMIIFEINGCSQYSIELIGKGCQLLLEPKIDPLLLMYKNKSGIMKITQINEDNNNNNKRCINMGHLRIGQISRRFITLINKSYAPICLHQIHFNQSYNNNNNNNLIHIQLCNVISIEKQLNYYGPITQITTPLILSSNGGQIMIMLEFISNKQIYNFNEEILCEISRVNQNNNTNELINEKINNKIIQPINNISKNITNMLLPIFYLYGSVNTYNIEFNTDSITFGSIVQGSQLNKRLILINSGDNGAKFEWDQSTFTSDLIIEPLNGFIGSRLEVPFTLTLKPSKLTREIRMENVTCRIQGTGKKTITITGACVPPTIIKEIQQFSTTVRQTDSKNLQIINRTNTDWQIKPIIDGEQWSGSKIIEIPAQQTGVYELKYKPVTMTTDGVKHKGTIFFPLPDGTGLLYNLSGISEPPKSMIRINREIECKKLHTEVVEIPNWLNIPQRFHITKEVLRPDKLDPSTTIKGLNYLDVPGDSSKEYNLSIFTYREGFTLVKVTFTNEITGEYQFFEVNFKSIRRKSLDVIRMQTLVRKPTVYTLTLENPLMIPVNFQMSTNISDVQCPNQLQIPANCEGNVTLEYLPIKVGRNCGKFEAVCNELGSFTYELDLQATPVGIESTVHFRTTIGQRHCQTVKFTNMTKSKTEFITNIDNPDYHCEKQLTVAPGVEAILEVIFEPTTIGNRIANLLVTSVQAGEYNFRLKGTALPPQPQGPITIKAGETKHIIFRNVFPTSILYSFQVDNTLFNLPKQSEIIRSGKEFRIPIGLDSNIIKSPITGKLVVTAVRAQSSAQITRKGQTSGIVDSVNSSSSSSSSPQQQQQSTISDLRSSEKGEGFQWVYYLRGVTL